MKAKRLQDNQAVPSVRARNCARRGPGAAFCSFCIRECCSVLTKAVTALIILAVAAMMILQDGKFSLARIAPQLGEWASGRLGGEGRIEVGDVSLSLGEGEGPAGLTLSNVRIGGLANGGQVVVPRIATGFSMMDSLQGRIRPKSLELNGIDLTLARDAQGVLRLGAAGDETPLQVWPPVGSGDELAQLTAFLREATRGDGPLMLDALENVSFEDVALRFGDQRNGEVWQADNAGARLLRDGDIYSGSVNAVLTQDGRAPLPVQASVTRNDRIGETRYQIRFQDARPSDLAEQVEVLAWLALVDAPVSGALAAEIHDDGGLLSLSGHLRMEQGAVTPMPGRTIAFAGADTYFTYDAERDAFEVSGLRVDTMYGALGTRGDVMLGRDAEGAIETLTAQLDLTDLSLRANAGEGEALTFSQGSALARVSLDPFRVDLGQVDLREGPLRAELSGHVAARPDRWQVSIDARAEELTAGQIMAGWPAALEPKLRQWLQERIEGGMMTRADAFIRADGGRPKLGLDFQFREARGQILDHMPPLVDAAGRGQLVGTRFDLMLEKGVTGPGAGSGVDLAGSRFTVADTRPKPSTGTVALKAEGAIPDILALIDNPPLRLLSRAGRTPDLASGQAVAEAELELPLMRRIKAEQVKVAARAVLTDVASDSLIEDKTLTAERLELTADTENMRLAGPVELSDVPMEIAFARGFGPDAAPPTVTGTLDVTPTAVAGLGIDLPRGTLDGRGTGTFSLTLPEGTAPTFDVDVALSGATVRVPALGWQKSAGSGGTLRLSGALTKPVRVDRIALDGPGLSLAGRLNLTQSGLAGAELSRLSLGNWLDAPVRWSAANGGRVTIGGGRVDLRAGLPPSASGTGPVLELSGTEVVVSDAIRLTGFQGQIASGRAGADRFSGRVNGQVPISGVIGDDGQIYLQSAEGEGGAILRAAGLNRNVKGGTLRVSVAPNPGGPMRGTFSLQNATLINAPVMAQMLSDISVIGLAERLSSSGINFRDAQGKFTIDGSRIYIQQARAVGSSLGITLDGIYDTRADALDLVGVVSPIYALNGIVQRVQGIGRLLGGRPGEGLLGANFRVTGRASAPQVAVNPLSLLTPGAAREIFQSRSRNAPGG
ncbi:hypothetical protein ACW9UR_12190 [Halovulum sp. GXIMD14794]